MILLLKAFKTEIYPTTEQIQKIHKTIGTCRFIYNFYILENKKAYEQNQSFLTANAFSKWLNNIFIPNHPEYQWIKDVSSKAVKQAMRNGETAFKRFFKQQSKFPVLKKKRFWDVKAYFPRNNRTDWICERHRVKIPTFGWVRLKEKGYIPTDRIIRSGTISKEAGRYYVSVLINMPEQPPLTDLSQDGIGIDVGIKRFAVCSNGLVFENINKTKDLQRLDKKLKRLQRACSRKYEQAKKENFKKGKAAYKNLQKEKLRISRLQHRITQIRKNHINQCINMIVKTKPSFVAMEDLNVKGMMKNRCVSREIGRLGLYQFREKLTAKCKGLGIEVRIINRWYPSSKTCTECGYVHKGLQLSDRIFKCPKCGSEIDRDYGASINIRDCQDYQVA